MSDTEDTSQLERIDPVKEVIAEVTPVLEPDRFTAPVAAHVDGHGVPALESLDHSVPTERMKARAMREEQRRPASARIRVPFETGEFNIYRRQAMKDRLDLRLHYDIL
jgi:hypothetical protein